MHKKLSKILPTLLLLTSAFLFFGCGEKQSISGKIPSVTFKTYAGESLSMGEEDKQVTLLVFWATWCQPCLMEIPSLIVLHEKLHSSHFRVVAVNVDDPDGQKVKAIIRANGIPYPVVYGSEAIMKQFGGIVALPTAFIIGKNGAIREKLQGVHSEEDLEQKVALALAAAE